MNLRRKRRLYLVSLLLLGGIITIALVLYALRANIDLFYTPTEIFQGKGESQIKPEVGQRLRVGGMVLPGSVSRDGETLNVNFKIYDDQGVVAVSYKGILPDLFRENQGVVVQGMLGPDNRVLAQEVLAKHDENYTPPEVQDAMKKNHSSMPTAYSPQNIPS